MTAWVKATEDTVFAVIETLRAQGVPVTQRSVKDALGGGSYGTIGPLLRRWKTLHGALDPVKARSVPVAMEAATRRMLEDLWHLALKEALDVQQKAAQEEQGQVAQAAALAAELSALRARYEEMSRLLTAKDAQIAAHIEARHAAETAAARAEVRAEALAGEIARAESMVLRQEQRAEAAERAAARAEVQRDALLKKG